MKTKITALFTILFSPVTGYEEMRYKGEGAVLIAHVMYALFFLVTMTVRQFTGFLFNMARPERLNILIVFLTSSGLLLLWVIANMGVCTLANGEGSTADIYVVTAYATLPYILLAPVGLLLSHVLVFREELYVSAIKLIQFGWSGMLLFTGVMVAHQYTVKKTIYNILATILGIGVILFLVFLSFMLVSQFVVFMGTLLREIRFLG